MLAELARSLAAVVFSAPCPLCDAGGASGRLCPDCHAALPRFEPGGGCRVCGEPLGCVGGLCAGCRSGRAFERVHALGPYRGSLRDAVIAVKYRGRRSLAHDLGLRLGAELQASLLAFDRVVPVPLGRRRRRQRGYNQAARLAAGVACSLGLPCSERSLRRLRETDEQAGLSRSARWRNVRGAFQASGVAGRSVVLVDDVLTTGATADAAARALRTAGAARVRVAALARAAFDADVRGLWSP